MGSHYDGPEPETRALGAFINLMRAAETLSSALSRRVAAEGLSLSQFGVMEALLRVPRARGRHRGRSVAIDGRRTGHAAPVVQKSRNGKGLTMAKGRVAFKNPAVLELEPGEYWWCRCGRSQDQPWCDSSHEGTEFEPVCFEITEKRRYALCRCKQTNTPPFCDGTHKTLTD